MKKHRIVFAGCGRMANTWIEYALAREDCEIVAVVDIHMEAAKSISNKYGLTSGMYTDLATAIQETEATLVFSVTIPAAHYEIGMTAMKLGCDVFTEKPLAETWEQCRELIRLSELTGRTYAVMQNRRYHPQLVAFRNMIASGVIGRTGYAGVDFYIGAHFGGFREVMDHPLLLDMAIHTFDQATNIG